MPAFLWFRRTHKWVSIAAALPLGLIFATGIALSISPKVAFLQPQAAPAARSGITISFEQMLEAARGVPETQIAGWDDGLNKNRYYNTMAKGYANAGVKYHSPHDTRHTFCTEMARLTSCDMYFCQLILGHADKKTTERYWHIAEAIQRNLRSNAQIHEDIEFVE